MSERVPSAFLSLHTAEPPRHRSRPRPLQDMESAWKEAGGTTTILGFTLAEPAPAEPEEAKTVWQKIRGWRPEAHDWLMVLPGVVWTYAIILAGVYGMEIGLLALLVALATSAVIGALSIFYYMLRRHDSDHHDVVVVAIEAVIERLDMLEVHLPSSSPKAHLRD